jgi:hypothetical protein
VTLRHCHSSIDSTLHYRESTPELRHSVLLLLPHRRGTTR